MSQKKKKLRIRRVSINRFKANKLGYSVVWSEIGARNKSSRLGHLTHLCTGEKMERGLHEFVSTGQVLIVLSCQLVWPCFMLSGDKARLSHAMGISGKTPTAETADQSCELSVHYVRIY